MAQNYTSGYGTFNPAAVDPYPIESTLAQQAYGSYPAESQTLMDQYWFERQANKNLYGQELAAQHEQFRQQIAQQLQEARWKAMGEAKDPTVLQLFANSPDSPLAGMDTGALTDLVMRARRGEDVTNLQHAGTGINQISQAGFDPTQAAAGVGITNLGDYSGPAMVQAARINAAARIAAARIGAGAGAGPSIHFTGPPDPNNPGANVTATWSGKAGQTPEGALDYARQHGLITPPLSTPPAGTNLPRAKVDEGSTGGQTKPAPASPPGNKALMDQVRTQIESSRGALGEKAYSDIQAGMKTNGGNPRLVKDANGRVKIAGASGQTYP